MVQAGWLQGSYESRGSTCEDYPMKAFQDNACFLSDPEAVWLYRYGNIGYGRAEIAAITHGHSLGYMPAAVLTHIINRIVFSEERISLKSIILEAKDTVAKVFRGDKHLKELTDIIGLGIALYCSLRHQNDFSDGVIAVVNHKGDSDSTGTVTGNIFGALLEFDAIEERWKTNLELIDVMIEMADDFCHGCQIHEFGHYEDPDWRRKYIYMRWKDEKLDIAEKTQFIAVRGDITKDHGVQAIVNAANTSLLGGGGVDGAIHRAAGSELLAECRLLHGCKTGQAKITKAYKLPCEYVIHTPGPHWNGGKSKEAELLASCYRSCLELAVENGIKKIAFPSIATGIYSYPLDQAAEIAVKTVKEFVINHPGELNVIKWVLFDDTTLRPYHSWCERRQKENTSQKRQYNTREKPIVKQRAEDVLSRLGIPMSIAIDMYLNQISLTGGIPFAVTLPKAPQSVNADLMTTEEIHARLQEGYDDMKAGKVQDAATAFAKFRENHGS